MAEPVAPVAPEPAVETSVASETAPSPARDGGDFSTQQREGILNRAVNVITPPSVEVPASGPEPEPANPDIKTNELVQDVTPILGDTDNAGLQSLDETAAKAPEPAAAPPQELPSVFDENLDTKKIELDDFLAKETAPPVVEPVAAIAADAPAPAEGKSDLAQTRTSQIIAELMEISKKESLTSNDIERGGKLIEESAKRYSTEQVVSLENKTPEKEKNAGKELIQTLSEVKGNLEINSKSPKLLKLLDGGNQYGLNIDSPKVAEEIVETKASVRKSATIKIDAPAPELPTKRKANAPDARPVDAQSQTEEKGKTGTLKLPEIEKFKFEYGNPEKNQAAISTIADKVLESSKESAKPIDEIANPSAENREKMSAALGENWLTEVKDQAHGKEMDNLINKANGRVHDRKFDELGFSENAMKSAISSAFNDPDISAKALSAMAEKINGVADEGIKAELMKTFNEERGASSKKFNNAGVPAFNKEGGLERDNEKADQISQSALKQAESGKGADKQKQGQGGKTKGFGEVFVENSIVCSVAKGIAQAAVEGAKKLGEAAANAADKGSAALAVTTMIVGAALIATGVGVVPGILIVASGVAMDSSRAMIKTGLQMEKVDSVAPPTTASSGKSSQAIAR